MKEWSEQQVYMGEQERNMAGLLYSMEWAELKAQGHSRVPRLWFLNAHPVSSDDNLIRAINI